MDLDIEQHAAGASEVETGRTGGGAYAVTVASICAPAIIAAVLMLTADSELLDIIFDSIADAYLQVSTFVAATFLIIYGLERALNVDTTAMLRRDTIWQVPVAAGLGALPGCGGAIINAIHGGDFLQASATRPDAEINAEHDDASTPLLDRIWLVILAPGMVLAVLVAFQFDVDEMFATDMLQQPATLLGVVGGVLALSMRLAPRFGVKGDAAFSAGGGLVRRTISDTNFVTVWVIFAYLVFELSVYFLGLDLKAVFDGWALFTPMIAVLLGFLPGCGPQVLVTTMYLSGIIPLSAQIGNALSNDGDALFPAIAIAPKVAIVATLYSAVPAIILAYSWMFWME